VNNDELNTKFFEAYHDPKMCEAIPAFLAEHLAAYETNEHVQAILHFTKGIAVVGDTDLVHPALFGMICGAWNKLLLEVTCSVCSKILKPEDVEFGECREHFEKRLDEYLK
jgi:hypothetical protein